MSTTDGAQLPAVTSVGLLKPYAKAIILEHLGTDIESAFRDLMRWLKEKKSQHRANREVKIVASGFVYEFGTSADSTDPDDRGQSEVDGFVAEVSSPPSWSSSDSSFREISYDLFIALRRRRLIAVHLGDNSLSEAFQNWLDKSPRPPFRRIPEGIINASLLTGDAKGLWLRGTHVQRATKPDSKVLSGRSLQASLGPIQDSSFSFSSARAQLPEPVDDGDLSGTVGATPRKSLVWLRATSDLSDYLEVLTSLLALLEKNLAAGISQDRPYPWLAVESRDLVPVLGAYELSTLTPEYLDCALDSSDEMRAAAEFLQDVSFEVRGEGTTPNFVAAVTKDGSIRGQIACAVSENDGHIRMSFGFGAERQGDDTSHVRDVLKCLGFQDLITVYYQSGHAISQGAIYSNEISLQAFEAWRWVDFDSYRVTSEKPPGNTPQEIHDNISRNGDSSLFSWVVSEYGKDAWLLCDDGSGEVADFVRIDDDSRMSLIHVKRSGADNPARPVNAAAYEQVLSQATKNFLYLDPGRLLAKLSAAQNLRRASWSDRERDTTDNDFMSVLKSRSRDGALEVVVVQPQMTKITYSRVSEKESGGPELMRLRLLETMLHSARGSAIGLGAELTVVGDSGIRTL